MHLTDEFLKNVEKEKIRQIDKCITDYTIMIKNCNTCCGTKELTNLKFLPNLCGKNDLFWKTELAALVYSYRKYHLIWYTTTSMDIQQTGENTQEQQKLLKEWGFTEFTRFININYPYRANETPPVYTIGLQVLPR